MTKARKIAVLTGSRGEWGYIRPVLRLIQKDPELDYAIIATHMHLLPEFGMSVREIESDGFAVAERIYMTFDGYNAVTMTKSLASLLLELPTALDRLKPDMILLAGDRGEQLMGAIAGNHMRIPVAHIQAGELSGNVDGTVRHAITKLAHLHFAAHEEFAERVRKMGEQDFRIHVTGASLVDEIVQGEVSGEEDLRRRYRLETGKPLVLAVQHPVTEEEDAAGVQVTETLKVLTRLGWPVVFIYPNADAGSRLIRNEMNRHKTPDIRMFRNLPRRDYLGLLKMAAVMVGNSSSGIMEAPAFGTPVVNIGQRQKGRLQAANVINAGYSEKEIFNAVQQAASRDFLEKARKSVNPYGDGHASERMVKILKTVEINDRLLNKEMAY